MEVSSYVFQSPYPSAIQVGRPDPQSSNEDKSTEVIDTLSKANNSTLQEAQSYKFQSTLSSVNVAVSSTDTGLSSSLESYNTLKGQAQASDAYSSE